MENKILGSVMYQKATCFLVPELDFLHGGDRT